MDWVLISLTAALLVVLLDTFVLLSLGTKLRQFCRELELAEKRRRIIHPAPKLTEADRETLAAAPKYLRQSAGELWLSDPKRPGNHTLGDKVLSIANVLERIAPHV